MNKHQTPTRKQRRSKAPSNIFDSHNLELRVIEPKTFNQQIAFNAFDNFNHHMLLGSAGTGKSMLALYKALRDVNEGKVKRITIFRSAVATRDLGFLPGSEELKMEVYASPYINIVNKLFGRDDAWGILTKIGIINFESTSFQRGNTLDDQVVILDETQNCSPHEADTIITRAGNHTKLIICGDLAQQDLVKQSEKGVFKVLNILKSLPIFHVTTFTSEDIVRSGLVKDYIIRKEQMFPNGF